MLRGLFLGILWVLLLLVSIPAAENGAAGQGLLNLDVDSSLWIAILSMVLRGIQGMMTTMPNLIMAIALVIATVGIPIYHRHGSPNDGY